MASTGMEADGSRPPSQAAPPENSSTNSELCELCLQALTIDDQLAGGTARVNTSDGTTTLDLSGFARNYWSRRPRRGIRQERRLDSHGKEQGNTRGSGTDSTEHRSKYSWFCAGNQHKRLVTLPWMFELSASAVGTCCLCSRLRALFIDQYAKTSWWDEHGSTLHFTIQYEWTEYRTFFMMKMKLQCHHPCRVLMGWPCLSLAQVRSPTK